MRIIPRIFVATLAVALMLSGCVPMTPSASRTPKASAAPVFASEAEALAAATKAYAAYVKVSDEILADGGAGPERINAVATGAQLAADLAGFGSARKERIRSKGVTTFDSVTLQRYDRAQVENSLLSVYLCEDISNVEVLNDSGVSVVAAGRPNRVKYQIVFDRPEKGAFGMLVAEKSVWGDGQC
jgi:predicted flap endonuclease-1-like 5' DNA nuclease